ncbi:MULTISPECIES: LuxR C-terminal-related transcriptional regulator [unclassified Streptomyces]|uniref:LuxR C-terminal-related transcriptional regulator n=1 Tax=unclassified Streptomyces TaxID=2593676 RepID=UPI00344DFC30
MNGSPPRNRRELDAALTEATARALATAGTAGPSVLVVTGGVGTGKSRTLHDVPAGPGVVTRRAAVGELVDRGPYSVVSRVLGIDLGRPVPADADDRLLARLDELCALSPTLLTVDDAHEADAASLSVLHMMASAARDLPLALLIARRPAPEREYLTRLLRGPDVAEFVLPPLDEIDLDALVRERTGRRPGPRLRSALLTHRDNALHVTTLIDDLTRLGAFDGGERVELLPGCEAGPAGLLGPDHAVGIAPGTWEGPVREVARALAVIGRPVEPEDLAAVVGWDAVAVVEPVQGLIDRAVVAFDAFGRIAFTHDSYRDAVDRAMPEPLRRVLHAAAARRGRPSAERVHHVIASGAPPEAVLSAVQDAADDLAHAPAVEADLLAGSAVESGASAAALELAIRRSRALARSGQMRRAEAAARTALDMTADPARTVELRRVLIFALTVRGEVAAALALVDEALRGLLPPRVRDILVEHRRQLVQLGGLEPLTLRPPVPDPLELTLTGLVTEAVRLCLTGSPHESAELAWEASRRHMSTGVDPYEGVSSDIWPPFVELFLGGPRAAREALLDVRRLRENRAAHWQAAPHQLLSASIDMSAGRLDDAALSFDTGLELAETGELAWTSLSVGARALIDVLRGDLDAADVRLSAWESGSAPLQFGIPQPARAWVALLEARRKYAQAARLARRLWADAAERHCFLWLATVAPEWSRVAIRAADDELRAVIARDLVRLPRPLSPALAPAVRLAEALTGTDDQIVERALEAAEAAHRAGETLTEMAAWEEAAVAAATLGDKDRARRCGRQALQRAEETGASGVAGRVKGRLRAVGVRLGGASARRRPAGGWAALTPTEARIAELIASGLSGPGIARALHVSPRTVQTHVSHTLAKLALSSRIELAAVVTARRAQDSGGS